MSNRYKKRKKGEKEEVVIRKQRFKRVIFYRYHQHLGRNQSQYFSLRDFDLSQKNSKGPLGFIYNVQYQGKPCVLKEIGRTQMKNYGVTKHMIYQTSIAKKLKHPFLLKLYAVFEDDQSMYFIHEKCGDTYSDAMKSMTRNKENFTINQIRRTATQLLLLIEYFRSKKTVLKGIHPANILFNKDGFIRLKEPGIFNTRKYLYWMPPEHLKNKKFTKESDIWTFGVFIYWMLTHGNIPYPRIYTVHMLLMKMRLNKIKWPKMEKKVDPVAKDFVCKLLAFRPKGRLGSGKKGIQKLKNHRFVRDELENIQKEMLRNQFAEIAAKDMKERCRSLCELESLRGDFSIQLKNRWIRGFSDGQRMFDDKYKFVGGTTDPSLSQSQSSSSSLSFSSILGFGTTTTKNNNRILNYGDSHHRNHHHHHHNNNRKNYEDSSRQLRKCKFLCNSSCYKRKERERLKILGYEENEYNDPENFLVNSNIMLSYESEEEGEGVGDDNDDADNDDNNNNKEEEDESWEEGCKKKRIICMNNEIRIWKSILLHL